MSDQNPNQAPSDKAVLDQMALSAFVDDLIKTKKDPQMNDSNYNAVKELLLGEVNAAINTHLVNRLSEQAQQELDKLLDTEPSDQALNQFFIKNIPNLEVEIAAALLNFRAAYLYPLQEQIAKAVESISPAEAAQTTQKEEIMPAPLSPAPVENSPHIDTFDLTMPKAPTAPLSSDDGLKKWN